MPLSRILQRPLTAVAIGVLVAAGTAQASSHREAPYVTQFPKVDATDFYLFNSYEPGREDYVTLLANYIPLQDAYGGPNYFTMDQNAVYEIHIDNDGDAIENLTFQFRFDNNLAAGGEGVALTIGDQLVAVPLKAVGPISDTDTSSANFSESFSLSVIEGQRRSASAMPVVDRVDGATQFAKPFDYVGDKTFGNEDAYIRYVSSLTNSGSVYHDVDLPGCNASAARVFVGQRKDSFAVNLGRAFDLINFDPIDITDQPENNILADKNVTTLALEVHKSCLVGSGNGVIGGWTTASKQQLTILNPTASFERPEVAGGAWTQISRLGNPLVNELVIGLKDKNRFNASEPKDDGQFASYVTNPTLPAIINLLFNGNNELSSADIAPSNFPRNDLVAAFLTGVAGVTQMSSITASEMIRLNTSIAATPRDSQSNLGVAGGDLAGFPNGRRPGDDAVDLALRAMMGAFCHAIPVDLNADGTLDDSDNLLLCGATAEQSRAAAPVGTVALSDGAAQNATQFMNAFPYLANPIPGSAN
ncbi:hypothetical protein AB833_03605 [Chromatiales bacterium (ex Bugula neritina AB1)]|nr:hypothetical protein AB833_03605 [Chromatiales bacterium (ex Bugula neritina AB1)]